MLVSVYPLWEVEEGQDNAFISYYKPVEKTSDWSVIIFPGGAYSHLATHEGKNYAEFLNEHGISAFVVEYRVAPNHFPAPLLDARHAIRFVRSQQDTFDICPDKIAVMGSSAGGHLASLVSNYHEALPEEVSDPLREVAFLPNAQILCYPVISVADDFGHVNSGKNLLGEAYEAHVNAFCTQNLVSEKTPKAFIWHTFTDDGVSVLNSLSYVSKMKEFEVPAELHVFPVGHHGMGLGSDMVYATPETVPYYEYISVWGELLIRWIRSL